MLIERMPTLLSISRVITSGNAKSPLESLTLRREACHLPNMKRCPISEAGGSNMIRKLKSGEYRLYSRKADPKTGKRRNLGTFPSREKAEKHERDVQYFKHH